MTAPNTSTAVMARRIEPADSLDFFPTPPWATRAFCEHVMPAVWPWPDRFRVSAYDPACGEGHMAEALADYFDHVGGSDIHDYGYGEIADFTHPDWWPLLNGRFSPADPSWIITNPPFNLAAEFVELALQRSRRGVAVLVRNSFEEGEERFERLYFPRPPQLMGVSVERIPMHKGRWVINGSTATAYKWFVWLTNPPHDWGHCRTIWIPKSRRTLTRPDDWLRFGGCSDLPKTHKAVKLMEAQGKRHALSVEAVRCNMAMERAKPGSIGDVRRHMEALL
ncbi:hypothetical protein [Aquamicrobium defluvii]|uniref:Methyltransferase n=1 Tax=Aquamicrobium defluvii TaxID=69279 RepID=A0A4R6YGQ2_9HYPH|nr:hypothetical protein [Aquamicrobium defluvii]TDR35712.1 hypothetical protein DES43_108137 [Aquamicrobium defluvii]